MKKFAILFLFFIQANPLPAFANNDFERGIAAAKMGHWNIALKSFKQAWQIKPLSPVILYNLGLAHAKVGNNPAAVAWLEAYLAATPPTANSKKIRETIAKLEVMTEASVDALFERQLSAIEQAPFDQKFVWYSGKHADAMFVVRNLASIGKLKKARETRDLAEGYARKIGGTIFKRKGSVIHRHVGLSDQELNRMHANALARSGKYSKAKKYVKDPYQTAWQTILFNPLASTNEVRNALIETTYDVRVISHTARGLWLKGDVESLKILATWLIKKDAKYHPARVEVGHALLGLGYKNEAVAFAKKTPRANANMPAARYAVRLFYENPDLMSVNCYEKEHAMGSGTLWRMLDIRYRALKGTNKKISADTGVTIAQNKNRKRPITFAMKSNHAWARAFASYANGNIAQAKSILRTAKQDVTSFLIIALRNAATRNPDYAAKIAAIIEPSSLAAIMLSDASRQAEKMNEIHRAKLLKFYAFELTQQQGGSQITLNRSKALQKWIYLGLFFEKNPIFSDFQGALKNISDRKGITFDSLELSNGPFVSQSHHYACPSKAPNRNPIVTPVREAKKRTQLSDVSEAAAYLGKALMHIQAVRQRVQ